MPRLAQVIIRYNRLIARFTITGVTRSHVSIQLKKLFKKQTEALLLFNPWKIMAQIPSTATAMPPIFMGRIVLTKTNTKRTDLAVSSRLELHEVGIHFVPMRQGRALHYVAPRILQNLRQLIRVTKAANSAPPQAITLIVLAGLHTGFITSFRNHQNEIEPKSGVAIYHCSITLIRIIANYLFTLFFFVVVVATVTL